MATTTKEQNTGSDVGQETRYVDRNRPNRVQRLAKGLISIILVVGLLGSIAYAVSFLRSSSSGNSLDGALTHTAKRGTLRITVTEDGNVESASNVDVKCQVAGGGTILWIVEDGKQVEEGDVLVRLDESAIVDQLNAQRIVYEKALATKIQAEENFEAAKIAVQQYVDGTFVQELQTLETQITIAMENLRSTENLLKHTEGMARRGFVTELQLEADEFAVQRAKLELESAKTAKRVLVEFTKPKMIKELEAARDAAEAHKRSDTASFNLEKDRMERLEIQLKNCVIHAPTSGMVVWANDSGRRRSSETPQVEEGAIVREQQTLIRLPDLTNMQAKVTVHETKVDQIAIGMPARIRIQDRFERGEVVAVANQPEPGSWFSPDVKEYATTVKINGSAKGLKPGMTAEVEIEIAKIDEVLLVPVTTVVEQGGQFFAWVRAPKGPERRQLILGLTNDKFIEVTDGIRDDEEVLLNPRAVVPDARDDSAPGSLAEDSAAPSQEERSGGAAASGDTQSPGDSPGDDTGPAAAGSPGEGMNPAQRFQQMDTNGDGKLGRDEAPAQMQSFFDRLDTNGDGALDAAEMAAMRKMMQGGGGLDQAEEGQP